MTEDKLLCACLYETIIEEETDCIFQDEEVPTLFGTYDIDYAKDLLDILNEDCDDYDEKCFINEVYERLVILTNEQLNHEGEIYSRVARIIFDDYVIDLTDLFINLDVSVWSNGKAHTGSQDYLLYHKGKLIDDFDCPPTYHEIKNVLTRNIENGIIKDFDKFDYLINFEKTEY